MGMNYSKNFINYRRRRNQIRDVSMLDKFDKKLNVKQAVTKIAKIEKHLTIYYEYGIWNRCNSQYIFLRKKKFDQETTYVIKPQTPNNENVYFVCSKLYR
ncbi:hypothetical protein A3Q56_07726 [Intoshia linei]|uniref:Uncharacterized protein n=1 Tax=Intoshia linei TaxID=1819745 RepID=A0A177ARC5_9BILA|nr:hypothetical protein A3Q56_07726 [Intoshia linei]